MNVGEERVAHQSTVSIIDTLVAIREFENEATKILQPLFQAFHNKTGLFITGLSVNQAMLGESARGIIKANVKLGG